MPRGRPWSEIYTATRLIDMGDAKAVLSLTPERSENGTDGGRIAAIIHSFIVKIWVEPESQQTGASRWHGHITHVATNERRYLKGLNDIGRFIPLYVADVGREAGVLGRIKQWLKH